MKLKILVIVYNKKFIVIFGETIENIIKANKRESSKKLPELLMSIIFPKRNSDRCCLSNHPVYYTPTLQKCAYVHHVLYIYTLLLYRYKYNTATLCT